MTRKENQLPSAPSPAGETAEFHTTPEGFLHCQHGRDAHEPCAKCAVPEPVPPGGAAEVCDECGRPSNQLSEDSEKFLLCPACTVAHPSAPEAAAAIPKGTKPHRFESKIQGAVCSYCNQPWFSSLHPEVAAPIAPAAVSDAEKMEVHPDIYASPAYLEGLLRRIKSAYFDREWKSVERLFEAEIEEMQKRVPRVSSQTASAEHTYASVRAEFAAYKEKEHAHGRGGKDLCDWLTLQLVEARNRVTASAEGDGWIAVTERLPEVAGERECSRIVLVHGANGFIYPRRYWKAHGGFGKVDATYWREMPTPPSGQEEKGSGE